MKTIHLFLTACLTIVGLGSMYSQSATVDVNLNIKHSVGGVSDFGRERHITVHAAITEPDWVGEEAKMKYLLNDLDVYLGRDNGASGFLMGLNTSDPNRPNHPDVAEMGIQADFWKKEHEKLAPYLLQYESRESGMINGTNPHPIYPTLSYFDKDAVGPADGRWFTRDIETSAEWVVEYLDKYHARSQAEDGRQMPKYWEVVNEPDMILNTGAVMMSSWENLFEYHNLVAKGIKARLGSDAPLVGGMTWGLHDFFDRDLGQRFPNFGYTDTYYRVEDVEPRAFARKATTSKYWGKNAEWFQWDVIWSDFMDAAGANMDFYAVHLYDWPSWKVPGGAIRAGGHVEAALDMIEWYDINKFGKRKPIVLSEYGAVAGYIDQLGLDTKRRDWENLKPFSSMMMQFLERPDYIVKSMPFTPIKAEWGDFTKDGNLHRYPYTMMDRDGAGGWNWTEFIKWYELWSDVDGTRIDTKASDLDVQVDAYVDGKHVYLILNNLERSDKKVDLSFFGANGNSIQSVRQKHLFLNASLGAEGQPDLSNRVLSNPPSSVTIGAEATMILDYTFSNNVTINQTSNESKFYGQSLTGSKPHRKKIQDGTLTSFINNVSVPQKGEAMLRLCGKFFYDPITQTDARNKVLVNGNAVTLNNDWRGEKQGQRSIYFGVLEIPVPIEFLKSNNTIESSFLNVCEYTNVSMQVWDMSIDPGRTGGTPPPPIPTDPPVAVTGVTVTPATLTVNQGAGANINANVLPANATNKDVTWSTNNANVATVNASGRVTGVNQGTATITATTADGNRTATARVTVNGTTSPPPPPPTGGNGLIIEAENFVTTGGTFNDGQVPLGVNKTAVGINYVNAGDYAEYTISVEAGTYAITYQISTPSDNAEITFKADGNTVSRDAVPNNGQWDSYQPLRAGSNVTLSAGTHTIRIEASGSNQWQWNLDKIELTKVGGTTPPPASTVDGGTISGGPFTFTVGDGIADNATGISLSGNKGKNSKWVITDGNSNILGLPATLAGVQGNNFDVAPAGVCLIWHLSYEDGLGGDTVGTNLANLTGTFDLSNSIRVNRNAVVVTPPPSGGASLVIQAEDFSNTGGTFEGFQTYNTGGVTATNFNQTGDWAEYTVNISQSGSYSVEYFISTPLNGPAIEFILDGVSQMKDNVSNNGSWDSFVSMKASRSVTLSAGTHVIRLLGAGTNGWEWNLDRFVLSSGNGAKGTLDASALRIYPNPANEFFNVVGFDNKELIIDINDMRGVKYTSKVINSSDSRVQINDLAKGVYFVQISTIDGLLVKTMKFIRN